MPSVFSDADAPNLPARAEMAHRYGIRERMARDLALFAAERGGADSLHAMTETVLLDAGWTTVQIRAHGEAAAQRAHALLEAEARLKRPAPTDPLAYSAAAASRAVHQGGQDHRPAMIPLADLPPVAWVLLWARRADVAHDVWASPLAAQADIPSDLAGWPCVQIALGADRDLRDEVLKRARLGWLYARHEFVVSFGITAEHAQFWTRARMALDLAEMLKGVDAAEAGLAESDLTALGWMPAQVRRHAAAALGMAMEMLGLPAARDKAQDTAAEADAAHQRQFSGFAQTFAAAIVALVAGPMALALLGVASLI